MTATTFPLAPTSTGSMADEPHDSATGRRQADRDLVKHVQAADTGISLMWRWAQIATTIICFGFTLGVVYTKFEVTEQSILELRTDIRDSRNLYVALDKQTDRNTLDLVQKNKEIDELRQQLRELRATVDTMRSMREAYVYNSAATRGVKPSVPP